MSYGKIAVIGAGLSGATAAAALAEAGFEVRVFEKARGMGGRMATRRQSGFEFDHGAQYFTVRSRDFSEAVESWIKRGLAAPWNARFASLDQGHILSVSQGLPRYVGTPRMNTIPREMLRGIDVTLNSMIDGAVRLGESWKLVSDNSEINDMFDVLILTVPPAQARVLLGPAIDTFTEKPDTIMDPCWAVMAAFDSTLDLAFDAGFVNGSSLSWIARNSTKPGRRGQECWVLHGSREWSRDHIEAEPDWVSRELMAEFFRQAGVENTVPSWSAAHRWRYAQAAEPLREGCLWSSDLRLGLCGDWCRGSRVEGAFLSGRAVAARITRILPDPC